MSELSDEMLAMSSMEVACEWSVTTSAGGGGARGFLRCGVLPRRFGVDVAIDVYVDVLKE